MFDAVVFRSPPEDDCDIPCYAFLASSQSHRGEDILEAAERGNVGEVRRFLRVDPDSVKKRGGIIIGRSLGGRSQFRTFTAMAQT